MRLICPACRKENEAFATRGGCACPRCGAELSALLAVARAAARYRRAALEACENQDWPAALDYAERSWSLQHSTAAASLACLAAVGLRRRTELLRWRPRAA